MMLSMFPNMDDRPRLKSIPKKSTAQTGAPGMWSTASVKTMKARPVPEALCNMAQVCQHAPGTHTCASTPPGTHTCASTPPGHTRGPAFPPGHTRVPARPLGHTHVPAHPRDPRVPAHPWDTRVGEHPPRDTPVCQHAPGTRVCQHAPQDTHVCQHSPQGHTRVPAGATPGRTPTLTLPAGRPGCPPGSGRGDPAPSGPCYHILWVHLCGEVPCPLNHLRRGTRAPGLGLRSPFNSFPQGPAHLQSLSLPHVGQPWPGSRLCSRPSPWTLGSPKARSPRLDPTCRAGPVGGTAFRPQGSALTPGQRLQPPAAAPWPLRTLSRKSSRRPASRGSPAT